MANYLDMPLLQAVSIQLLEGVAKAEVVDLPVELAEPLMKKTINNALHDYIGEQWLNTLKVVGEHDFIDKRKLNLVFVAWAPNNKRIVSGAWDGNVFVWNVVTGKKEYELKGYPHRWALEQGSTTVADSNFITSVAWSPNGNRIAFAEHLSKNIYLWDLGSGNVEAITTEYPVISIAWSPDGEKIAFGQNQGNVYVYDTANKQKVLLGQHNNIGLGKEVYALSWSPDSKKLVSGSFDKTVRVWDVLEVQEIKKIDAPGTVALTLWSPDGRMIAYSVNNDAVYIWHLDTGLQKRLMELPAKSVFLSWAPNSKQLAVQIKNTISIRDVESGAQYRDLDLHADPTSIVWSPDGSIISVGLKHGPVGLWQSYQAFVNQCSFDELLFLYKAVSSWQQMKPYLVLAKELVALKERYKDSVIAPLVNDERLFAAAVAQE